MAALIERVIDSLGFNVNNVIALENQRGLFKLAEWDVHNHCAFLKWKANRYLVADSDFAGVQITVIPDIGRDFPDG